MLQVSFAQDTGEGNHYHTEGVGLLSTGNTGTGANINVVYHRCTWTADPDDVTKTLTGTVTTYFKTIAAGVNAINFDFNNASFNNSNLIVKYHNNNCNKSFPVTGNIDILNIQLPITIAASGTLDSITIEYQGIPPAANGSAEGYQRKTDAAGNNYIYTLSESYEDKDWWPCKADMQDKIDSIDINLIVPRTFWAAANGSMIDSTDDGSNRTFKFKHRYPIASYLVAIAIAKYKRFNLGNLTVGSKNVPFIVNMFSGKTATEENNILVRMNNNKLAFAALNNLYGDYGFANEKHGFYEFGFSGGMEHQTMSGIGTSSMQSNTVLAHELGHQWWGDKVSFSTWNHLWLAEGFATYSEALAFEYVPSIGINPVTKMASNKNTARSNISTSILINNITNSNTIWTNNNTTAIYERGCMVAAMLRCLLGDTKFFAGCKNYLSDPLLAYQSATTADLQRNMETQFGENMSNFFTEWTTKKGTPDYLIEWGNKSVNTINIKLAQSITSTGSTGTAATFFPMPVVIKIANANNTADTTIVIYHKAPNQVAYAGDGVGATINSNIISYNLSFTPASLIFDPLNRTMATAAISYNATLPVDKVEINVRKSQGLNNINLSITANEPVEKVELGKSIDGVDFVLLGKMNLQSKTATTQLYTTLDKTDASRKVYYRAKVYTASINKYSNIVAVDNNLKTTFNISPNPATSFVKVYFDNLENSNTQFKMIDALGKEILQASTNSNTLFMNIESIASGIYVVQMFQNKKLVATQQLIIK
ncbi:MAG: M1 family aminopeptidase [Bacteroidetes bacterium]|nr:M1 family aminopeptidase [Bacteroidota bacterium]